MRAMSTKINNIFHFYNTPPLIFLAINQHPIGHRVLPAEYIGTLDKPPNMTWPEFSAIVQDQFMERQKKEIERETKQLQQINALEGAKKQLIEKQKQLSDKKKEREKQKLEQEQRDREQAQKEQLEKENFEREEREKQQRAREQVEKEQREKEQREKEQAERDRKERERIDREEREKQQAIQEAFKIPLTQSGGGEYNFFDPDQSQVGFSVDDHTATSNGANADMNMTEKCAPVAGAGFDGSKPEDSSENLSELGTLFLDSDVLFALPNLKKIGSAMRQSSSPLQDPLPRGAFPEDNSSRERVRPSSSKTLFPTGGGGMEKSIGNAIIKKENDGGVEFEMGGISFQQSGMHTGQQTMGRGFQSPPGPGRVFMNLKRHSEDTFIGSHSGKKRRTSSVNTTPNRGKVGGSPTSTPQQMSNSIDTLVAQADVKCKVADLGDTFLKKKKTTPSSSGTLYKKVKERGLDVYKFEPDAPQSFYRIMAHYAEWLDHIPLERRHITLIDDLFDFIFENRKYTQVN